MKGITIPIFPLPDVVLFPRVILPLHIFELRYQQMVSDILSLPENERLIAISNIKGKVGSKTIFDKVVTIGRLIMYEPSNDGSGKSDIVLLGEFTAEVDEIENVETPYRQVIVKNVREEYWTNKELTKNEFCKNLQHAIQKFSKRTRLNFEDLDKIPTEDLINSLSFSMNITSDKKQELLELQCFEERIAYLIKLIDTIGYYVNFVPDKEEYTDIN